MPLRQIVKPLRDHAHSRESPNNKSLVSRREGLVESITAQLAFPATLQLTVAAAGAQFRRVRR